MSDAIIVRAGNVTKSYVDAKLDLKADKIEGKGLSTNDYDNTAKEAVDSLGTASKCNTGTKEGNVPIINSEGKIDSSVLPSLAITDTFTAEDQDQMIGLSAQKGEFDVAFGIALILLIIVLAINMVTKLLAKRFDVNRLK